MAVVVLSVSHRADRQQEAVGAYGLNSSCSTTSVAPNTAATASELPSRTTRRNPSTHANCLPSGLHTPLLPEPEPEPEGGQLRNTAENCIRRPHTPTYTYTHTRLVSKRNDLAEPLFLRNDGPSGLDLRAQLEELTPTIKIEIVGFNERSYVLRNELFSEEQTTNLDGSA